MSERILLNDDWLFTENYTDDLGKRDFSCDGLKKVRLPHTVKVTPFNYFDEEAYQMVSGYRRSVHVPAEWKGKKLLLTIDGAAHEATVFWNGNKVAEHHCGYTAFTADVTDYALFGEDNILSVRLDSRESLDQPPFGFVIDYMTYGGLYREVWLDVKEQAYIDDVFCHSKIGEIKGDSAYLVELHTELTFASNGDIKDAGLSIKQSIRRTGGAFDVRDGEGYTLLGEQAIDSGKQVTTYELSDIRLWDIDSPYLYEVRTELLKDGSIIDENTVVTGFRSAEFKSDGFYLNGRKLKIRGLNRHQCYPYVGYAMPEMAQRMDADVLKDELGVNAVRTSHYPQSHYFLDECDRKGLLVFTEIPGWQHIGGAAWKDQAVENVRDMVKQYRNHASIILWGVRINESVDDDEFYVRTNQAAHGLDPTRQTGGVRAHMKSSLLEDVYTYNDFIHDGKKPGCNHKATVTSDDSKPYMVTEYNGHMYPTKSFDWEEHRAEHAMRHVRVLDAVAGESDIAGSFGWCMFDYNTHKDFGSGDRICYHGVLDMFRNHKLAAEVYAVQQEETPVLAVSSSMDIGEHPGCYRGPSYILSNADSVRMYRNGQFLKEYTNDDSPYKNLLHGPMMIDEFVGDAMKKSGEFTPEQESMIRTVLNAAARYGMPNLPENEAKIAAALKDKYNLDISDLTALYNKYVGDWGEQSTVYRFEAIKDGQVVKTLTKEPMHKLHLAVACDHTELEERNTYDVASLRILALDENDNVQSFFGEPVTVEVDGPIEVIGPSVFSLKGGMGGTYIKTTGESGEAAVKVTCAQTEPIEIRFSCLKFLLT